MRVLCIYPGMNPFYNDNFHALRHMAQNGAELVVLAGSSAGLKSTESAPRHEVASGIPIHRRWKNVAELNSLTGQSLRDAEEIADALKPDVIWCSLIDNRALGQHLSKRHGVPWIQLTESLFDAQLLIGRRQRWWRRVQLEFRAERLRQELLAGADLIVHSNPTEVERAARLSGRARVTYVPWCSEVPGEFLTGEVHRENTAIHIGSLYHFKNAQKLPWMIDRLRQASLVDRIDIVGPGPYQASIEALVKLHPETVTYAPSVSRREAIQRLRASRFAFSAAKIGGWGLFGDCWATETPVLSLHDPYTLEHGKTAYCIRRGEDPGAAARKLCEEPMLYSDIQSGGQERYLRDHTAEVVGDHYLELVREVAR